MKKLFTPLLLVILVVTTLSRLSAQKSMDWENHNTFSSVRCLLDIDTAILAATNGGIASINKSSLAVIYISKANSEIQGEVVSSLARDASGDIWAGTSCGLSKYHNGSWTHYTSQNSPLPSDGISALYFSTITGTLLAGLTDGNVVYIDNPDWTVLTDTAGNKPLSGITALVTDTAGNIWAGTLGNGVFKWDGNTWMEYNLLNSPVENNVRTLALGPDATLWVGNPQKLVSLTDTTWASFPLSGCSELHYITIDTAKLISLSTDCGLMTFDGTTWSSLLPDTSLTDNHLIWHVINSDFIWAGTQSKGVDQISATQSIINVALKPDMTYPAVKAIKFEVSSKAFIAYDSPTEGSLSNYNGTSTWLHYSPDNTVLGDGPIMALQMQSTKLWIATFGNGVFTKSGNTWTTFTTSNSNLASDSVTALAINSLNSVLIGFNNGMVQIKGAFPGFSPVVAAGLIHSRINRIVYENNNSWFATDSTGLVCYNSQGLTFFKTNNSGIPSNSLHDVRLDVYQKFWIATDSGLVNFDGTNVWNVFNTSNSPLPEDFITTVSIGKDSSIWVGTHSSGVARYKDSIWTVYNTCNSPLVSDNIKIIETAPNGKVFIGTDNGLSIIIFGSATGQAEFADATNTAVYPNPGTDKIHFDFDIPGATHGKLRLFNAFGQQVLSETADFNGLGTYTYTWDLTAKGSSVKPGLYFYTLEGNFNTRSGKVVVVR